MPHGELLKVRILRFLVNRRYETEKILQLMQLARRLAPPFGSSKMVKISFVKGLPGMNFTISNNIP